MEKRLTIVRPSLPHWLREVHVTNLRVGDATLDISFKRTNSHTRHRVTRLEGELIVVCTRQWPD